MVKTICSAALLTVFRSFELRLKRTKNAPGQGVDDSTLQEQPLWILCSIFPELTEGGGVHEMVGTITDIRYVQFQDLMFNAYVELASRSGVKRFRLPKFPELKSRNGRSFVRTHCYDCYLTLYQAAREFHRHNIVCIRATSLPMLS
jgi:hypothetical protein